MSSIIKPTQTAFEYCMFSTGGTMLADEYIAPAAGTRQTEAARLENAVRMLVSTSKGAFVKEQSKR
ncbi:MAG: hypothetical protein ABSG41_07565 [Bryobacteraceae bacterium]|jgi:hypothetical protein